MDIHAPTCASNVPRGLKIDVTPGNPLTCGWPERCKAEQRCFWARFHQFEDEVSDEQEEQADFGF